MGLEIPQEFWPITPIRTNPDTRTYNSSSSSPSVKHFGTEHHPEDRMRAIHNQAGACKGQVEVEVDNNGEFKFKVPDSDPDEEGTVEGECHTPKSEDHLLKTPLVCPPAPRKPRPVKRKSGGGLGVPSQLYIHVPTDLSSVFFPLNTTTSSKKIKAV